MIRQAPNPSYLATITAQVLERVAPLEKQLEAVVNSLSESQARLTQCEEQLVTLDEQVSRYEGSNM